MEVLQSFGGFINQAKFLKLQKLSKSTISLFESNIRNQSCTLRNECITIPARKYITSVSLINRHHNCRYFFARQYKKEIYVKRRVPNDDEDISKCLQQDHVSKSYLILKTKNHPKKQERRQS